MLTGSRENVARDYALLLPLLVVRRDVVSEKASKAPSKSLVFLIEKVSLHDSPERLVAVKVGADGWSQSCWRKRLSHVDHTTGGSR